MSNPIGDDAQSGRDEEDREGELLCLKIKAQLEDLFSDSHLAEDGFLLKHVQKNKQGYVSLKLLTCLKKIKVLTTNWYMTLAGAEYSELLEVNDESTKVRRIEPLPKWLLYSPTSKLLLAWNLSEEETTGEEGDLVQPSLSERILKKVSAHGKPSSSWILHPGKELPKVLQCYGKRHKELGQHLCVVVKFDRLEEVRQVYDALKAEEDGRGMCVVPLGFQSVHNITKDKPSEDKSQPEGIPSQENPLETSEDSIQEEPSAPAKVPDETPDTSQSSENSVQRPSKQISSSYSSQPFSGLTQRYSKKSWCSGDYDRENSQSPWVLRRKFAASVLNPKVDLQVSAPCLMQRVLRQPLGPDGTKGFQSRRKQLQLGGRLVII
ncbi:la-related protein 6b [Centropristis striata]|uniref:la-related protein 6b n=1 Tax=Centropristis striata TaxID=184440 RepID=UPI0027DFBD04|nr:la-related protein 6b [Centropristis striata]